MNTTELRLFTDWLAEHLGKHEDRMLTSELLDLMQQVQVTGRSGSMTLKVGIKGAGGVFVLTVDHKATRPTLPPAERHWFVGEDGPSQHPKGQMTIKDAINASESEQ